MVGQRPGAARVRYCTAGISRHGILVDRICPIVAERAFLAIVTFLFWLPISYIATLLVGVPVYRFLCARNFTAFWMAPAAGFISGTAVIIVSYFLVMVILRLHLSPMDKDTTILTVLPGALLMGGLPGAASGAIVWLIARPDRQSAGAATVKNS